jgi:hypothetical protein
MRTKVHVGDIVAIPLPSGRFAFGRILKDASIGVFRYLAASYDAPPPTETKYLFIVGVYEDVLKSGEWQIVKPAPFEHEEDAWPPPNVIRDPISGRYSIYHKGQIRPALAEECENLEPAAVWDKEHIVNRIVNARL